MKDNEKIAETTSSRKMPMQVEYVISPYGGLLYIHIYEGWIPRNGEHVNFTGLQDNPAAPKGCVWWDPIFVVKNVVWAPQVSVVYVWCDEIRQ